MSYNTQAEKKFSVLKILTRFWPEIREHKTLITGSFAALMAEIGFRLLEPWPLKYFFDSIFVNDAGAPHTLLFGLNQEALIVLAAVSLVLIAVFRALSAYGSSIGFALAGNRVMTKIRNNLYKHVQSLPLSFHTKSRNGDLLTKIIGDMGLLQEVTVTALLPLLGNFVVLSGMAGVMLYLNLTLALLSLSVLPLFYLTTLSMGRKIHKASRKQRNTESAMAATLSESMTAIKTVQSLSMEGVFNNSFSSESKKSLKQGVKTKRLLATLERSVDILTAVSTSLVLWYGAGLVIRGELSPGELIVFLAYLKAAYKPLKNYAKYSGRLAKAKAACERVTSLLDLTPGITDLPGAVAAGPLQGSVEFKSVNFSYDPEKPVLKNVNFSVKSGEQVAVIAPSGAGKSTITGLIMRLYDPVSGKVLIDGKDVRSYTVASLRSRIGIVLQDTLLFASTVSLNISAGDSSVTEDEVIAAAKLANAHEFILQLPDGYNTVLGERGSTLSNGQRQRISIARSAIKKTPVLIFDEPTTGLDGHNAKAVNEALKKLSCGRTTFFITHDISLATDADRILYLENGTIKESGTHNELLNLGRRYASLFNLQNQRRENYAQST